MLVRRDQAPARGSRGVPAPQAAPEAPPPGVEPRNRLLDLSLAALGVVYGDIGTSPLYALRESFIEEHDVAVTAANVTGVLFA